jgi:hypothetical protein
VQPVHCQDIAVWVAPGQLLAANDLADIGLVADYIDLSSLCVHINGFTITLIEQYICRLQLQMNYHTLHEI